MPHSVQGSDAREAALGRIFGYSAVIRSGRARQDSAVAAKLVTSLLALQRSKSFLAEVSAASLLELLEQLDDTSISAVLKSVPELTDMLQSSPELASPEVYIFPYTASYKASHHESGKIVSRKSLLSEPSKR